MKPFLHIVKVALRRRVAVIGVIVTTLIIAALWGANITVLYPMVEIVFKPKELGNDFPGYVQVELDRATETIASLDEQLAQLEGKQDAVSVYQTQFLTTSRETWQNSATTLRRVQPWVDQYMPRGAYPTLLLIVAVLIGGTSIKLVALTTNLLLVQYISSKTVQDMREAFFRKALHLDLDHFGEHGSANLTSRLTNDVAHIGNGLTTLLGRTLREPLKMIVCLVLAAWVCPRLLLLVMVVSPVLALTMQRLSRAIRRASRRAMEEMSQLYGMLNDAFGGIRVVKSFNTQAKERARFHVRAEAFFRRSMKVSLYNTFARSTSEFMGMSVVAIAILAGGYLVINQQTHLLGLRMSDRPLQVGQVLMFFAFLIGATDPARKLSDVWATLQRGIAASSRVMEIIQLETRVNEPRQPRTIPRPHRAMTFDNVHFQYPSGPMVLRGIDLQVAHGETIALVGPNGCGKSTLISLLCRFDDPSNGEVRLDDVPIDQLSIRGLRRRLALVTQRTVLFDDTIENNIRYGSPSADTDAVVEAAKMAFADEFIRRKTPDGYQTLLGAGGVQLSGGQMQRLALARAFLRDPDILILDEATSAIDIESEQLIHEALEKFLVGRTGIMITHRSSSLAMADRVAVLDRGRVSDVGRHDDLLATNQFYRSLCQSDFAEAA
ncbi:MAG: ABC transporter ATP-binding protein [Planctomycetota bacterium]